MTNLEPPATAAAIRWKLKRMTRYLTCQKRLVYMCAWGDPQTVHSPSNEVVDVYADTDFTRVTEPDEVPVVGSLCAMAIA